MPGDLRELAGAVRAASVLVAAPASFDPARPCPILLVQATANEGHSSSRELLRAWRPAAAEAGWIVLAADPEPRVGPREDTLGLRLALAQVALAATRRRWPGGPDSPVAFAGFSGGAKFAGWLAALFARQGVPVAGAFLTGINEDTLATASRRFGPAGARLHAMPVFLQSGRRDRVATPAQHRQVEAELRAAGFRAVRLETTDTGHEPDASRLGEALAWFAAGGPPVSTNP